MVLKFVQFIEIKVNIDKLLHFVVRVSSIPFCTNVVKIISIFHCFSKPFNL